MRPCLLIISCLVISMAFLGCGPRDGKTQPRTNPKSATSKLIPPDDTPITTVSIANGRTLVELPVGSRYNLQPGDFFHIMGTDEEAPLKGTVAIQEVLGPERCLAYQVGSLLDRNRPFQAGDTAKFIPDLSAIGSIDRLQDTIEDERRELEKAEADDRKAHTAARKAYEKRLADLHRKHQTKIAGLQQDHQRAQAAQAANHQRALARQAAVHAADLAALRAALSDEAQVALKEERRAHQKAQAIHRAEVERLTTQIASLMAEQKLAQETLIKAKTTTAQLLKKHQTELIAEAETREVLEERIAQLESRLSGKLRPDKPVLSHDPNRNETILERLNRISQERDRAITQAKDLSDRHALISHELAALKKQMADIKENGGGDIPGSRMSALKDQARELGERNQALELQRLRSERSYYDLATRILQLPSDDAAVKSLQSHLHQILATSRSLSASTKEKPATNSAHKDKQP